MQKHDNNQLQALGPIRSPVIMGTYGMFLPQGVPCKEMGQIGATLSKVKLTLNPIQQF